MAYSDNKIIEALDRAGGNIAAAARSIGASRTTIHKRIESSEKVKEAYDNVNECNLDRAENNLMELVSDKKHRNHFDALKFYLRTKGKKRGYIERVETEHSGELQLPKLQVEIVRPDESQ
jgi:hypothetical protein